MLVQLIIISTILLILAVAGLGLTILVKKNGKFPDTHVGHNKNMRKLGISCAKNLDVGCSPVETSSGCAGCGVRLN